MAKKKRKTKKRARTSLSVFGVPKRVREGRARRRKAMKDAGA